MLRIDIDEKNGVAVFEPDAKLSESDFQNATKVIDPYIERNGCLNGLVISTRSFPGWQSFAGLISHLSFVKDHHKKIEHIAFVTDSPLGQLAEHLSNHFISAQVRAFKYSELESAKSWIIASRVG